MAVPYCSEVEAPRVEEDGWICWVETRCWKGVGLLERIFKVFFLVILQMLKHMRESYFFSFMMGIVSCFCGAPNMVGCTG